MQNGINLHFMRFMVSKLFRFRIAFSGNGHVRKDITDRSSQNWKRQRCLVTQVTEKRTF